MKKRFGLVIDLQKCTGCNACTVACKAENKVPDGVFRTRVREEEFGVYPNVKLVIRKDSCMHCQDAPCIKMCPTGASHYTEFGTVEVDPDLCAGCRYCVVACPYHARSLNPLTKLPEKCTFCHHRLKKGLKPACETTCVAKAIISGDLNNPNSEVAKAVAEGAEVIHPEYKTEPSIYYLPIRR